MSRPTLERFIAAHGITDASILLHRGPHQLERWRDGQDVIPEALADWLAEWDTDWRLSYSPRSRPRSGASSTTRGLSPRR